MSHIRRLIYICNANVEIETSFDPAVSRSVRRADLIALRTWDIEIIAPGGHSRLTKKNIQFAKETFIRIISQKARFISGPEQLKG